MKHGSLFSGIGGFDLAAQWMGWENVFQVEWDKWCRKILAKNFPDTLRFGDIVEFNKMLQNGEIIQNAFGNGRIFGKTPKERANIWEQRDVGSRDSIGIYIRERIGQLDILTGGFPCQPFSHAGKRKGTDDSRHLWPEMLTTIRILKPSFIVGENVAGLVSMENGKTLDRILSDLANEGYTTEQFIIPACAIGAWHRRDRIWIICYSKSLGMENGCKRQGRICQEMPRCGISGLSGVSGENVSDCYNQGLQRGKESRNIRGIGEKRDKQPERYGEPFGGDYWQSEPSVGRVANGIPNRVDRLKGLGNAIVPWVVYQIFKAIEEYDFRLKQK